MTKTSIFSVSTKHLIAAAVSFPMAYLLVMYFSNGINPIYVLAVTAALTFLYGKLKGLKTKGRNTVCAAVFSFALSAAIFIGDRLNLKSGVCEPILKRHILYLSAIFFAVFPAVFLLLEYIGDDKQFSIMLPTGKKKRIYISLAAAALITGFYLFAYLCHFPSISTYDSWAVLRQITGEIPYSNWHPIIYTLALRLFTGHSLWSLQTGAALFSLCQMLFMALSAGYTVNWMLKKNLHPAFAGIAALYYAIPPLFAAFSMTVWKDVPFGAVAVLYMLAVYDLLETKGEMLHSVKGILRFTLLSYFTGMLRHNGYYVIIVMTIILLTVYIIKQKRQCLRIVPFLILPVVLVMLSNSFSLRLGVEEAFSSEAFSIPAQQIARTVVSGGEITPQQKEELELFFDMDKLNEYNPFLADPAKNSIKQGYFNANKGGFIKLWISLMPKNAGSYVSAYLLQTHGYWHPGDKSETMLDPSANAFSNFGIEKHRIIEVDGVNAGAVRPYDFISIGLMVWIILFCGVSLIHRKQYMKLAAVLPIIGIWGTIMLATPTDCSFRYVYALPLALPVIIFITLSGANEESKSGVKGEG